MLMRKAIPTAPSLPFYCTNRLLADGRKLFLRLREAEDPETYALFNEESDEVMRVLVCDYGCWSYRSMSVVQFPVSLVLINGSAFCEPLRRIVGFPDK
jgi:hypothetical protein